MKKIILFLVVSICFFSCEKPKDETGPEYNAFVLAGSPNCKDAYVIKFDSNVTGLADNYHDNTYVEINLAEEHKEFGKKLMINFRQPTTEELISCEESPIIYPQIFIIEASD